MSRVIAVWLLWMATAAAQTTALMPAPKVQFFDTNGRPLAGGKVYTYAAGTSTPLATYADSTGGAANTNPVILDAAGRANIWLGAQSYKVVLKDKNDVQVWSVDNVSDWGQVLRRDLADPQYGAALVAFDPWGAGPAKTLADLAEPAAGGAKIIVYKSDGTGAIPRPVHDRLQETISILDFGAKCDGTTDDTLAIQAAIDRLGVGAVLVFPGTGTCVVQSLSVDNKSRITLRGAGAKVQLVGTATYPNYAGIKLSGTIDAVTIEGLNIRGSSNAADMQAGIWVAPGSTLTDIRILHNRIIGVAVGIAVEHGDGSSIYGFEIDGNFVEDALGTAPHTGYGIVCGTGGVNSSRGRIVNNYIHNAGRHSIYQSSGGGTVIANNVIYQHGYGGSTQPAISVQRSRDVVVSNNVVMEFWGGAIQVTPELAGANAPAYNIVISGNVFKDPQNSNPIMLLGAPDPLTYDATEGISVIGNLFVSDGIATPQVTIQTGRRLSFVGNVFRFHGILGDYNVIRIEGLGETAGTANYTNNIFFSGNTFDIVNQGGNGKPIFFTAAAAASSIAVSFAGNSFGTADPLRFEAAPTNPNIEGILRMLGGGAGEMRSPTGANLFNWTSSGVLSFPGGVYSGADNVLTGTNTLQNAGTVTLVMKDTTQAADQKIWQLRNTATKLCAAAAADTGAAQFYGLCLNRDMSVDFVGRIRTAQGGNASRAACWKADGVTLGWCSTQPDASGNCACN